jgi:hypothetical protein
MLIAPDTGFLNVQENKPTCRLFHGGYACNAIHLKRKGEMRASGRNIQSFRLLIRTEVGRTMLAGYRVLVVEDETLVAQNVREMLLEAEGGPVAA